MLFTVPVALDIVVTNVQCSTIGSAAWRVWLSPSTAPEWPSLLLHSFDVIIHSKPKPMFVNVPLPTTGTTSETGRDPAHGPCRSGTGNFRQTRGHPESIFPTSPPLPHPEHSLHPDASCPAQRKLFNSIRTRPSVRFTQSAASHCPRFTASETTAHSAARVIKKICPSANAHPTSRLHKPRRKRYRARKPLFRSGLCTARSV